MSEVGMNVMSVLEGIVTCECGLKVTVSRGWSLAGVPIVTREASHAYSL
jgi:hypothetical protein